MKPQEKCEKRIREMKQRGWQPASRRARVNPSAEAAGYRVYERRPGLFDDQLYGRAIREGR